MPQLKTHRQVDSDIREAALWYEERCAGLGGKFIDAVRNATGVIAENPLRNAVRFDDVRRLNLKRFPYSIWYFVSNEAAYVLGVVHNKRDYRRLLDQRRKQG
jgi:toxin ParE1/3/4